MAWNTNPSFTSNKPIHYLLGHGDYNSPLKLFSQDYDLASPSIHVVRINFWNLLLSVDSERQIFNNFFSNIMHFWQHFFQSQKHFWNTLFGISNGSCFDFSFISSIVEKRFSFIGFFSFGKRKKSAGAKSVEYGIWGIITILFLAKNSSTSINVWAVALSWWKIHDWFFHNSMRFRRIA